MRKVAIIGVGQSKFGELWDSSFRDIVLSAGIEALEDAGLEGKEIEAMFVGNMSGGRYLAQEHIAALIADYAGLAELHIPSTRVEAADASGGLALRQAYMAVASGMHDIVIAAGAEKVTDVGSEAAMEILASAADREWEVFAGATLASLYAMIARLHMEEFGTKPEDLAMVSVKNHKNATLNPKAQFRREISLEVALNSPYVAEPLRLFDCAPLSDGAAAVILASEEVAKKYTDTPVYISACCQASDYIALHNRKDLLTMQAVVHAAKQAYKQAGIEAKDIDVAEVHDSFTIAEILAYEDLGFAKKGEGAKLIREGVTSLDGDIPVNPSGGLKACGHAVGATGIRQAVEITLQLRGEADKRQVDAERGLALNVGGTGATAVVTIFTR
ncbi:thiolase domain-containing protein [Archaeoglobus veneficus]|uniref:Propanoyl-CoA C-acyltransferase n=1 Tax=Archaeoglobus veneficus (strain DSM 11195 / SNP6) TaxID=693661 RepID=F2KS98_ARCVS|nr:thiolase domain-containing protein [Archaeoglobus veneficus]AEA48037.1 Propanoyl-CoA C-acyltransferase [Archaeoglobus veneficus SNP6]